MDQTKKTYYIDIENAQIYTEPVEAAEWQFKIFATDEELAQLNEYINENYDADLKTFARAHVPFLEYHKESKNDEYDASMEGIYKMIYDLGDDEARRHIEGMGIL
ncbi:hydrolase [Cytobacillus pseudoceanisediminis]|nr:hydrolase [Cytobacillus firmus]MDM5224635.1 hydrolase [Cytobacillus sp. NJ13]